MRVDFSAALTLTKSWGEELPITGQRLQSAGSKSFTLRVIRRKGIAGERELQGLNPRAGRERVPHVESRCGAQENEAILEYKRRKSLPNARIEKERLPGGEPG